MVEPRPIAIRNGLLLALTFAADYIGGAVVAAVDLPRNLVLTLALPGALIMVVVTIAAIVFRPR